MGCTVSGYNGLRHYLGVVSLVTLLVIASTGLRGQGSGPGYLVLHTFSGGAGGGAPYAGLVADASGNLYGTTQFGGNTSAPCPVFGGCGTVYKIDPQGNESLLYTFTGGSDGASPTGGLVVDSAGNLYGTTQYGGNGYGTVFKIDPSGVETVLHSFSGPDGNQPVAGLMQDPTGTLYGVTTYGGKFLTGWGVVFKLDPNGQGYTVVHEFSGGLSGSNPVGDLIEDEEGNLYGTTVYGGRATRKCGFGRDGCGVAFKIDPAGDETVLYSFSGGADGGNPNGGLARDAAGNLFGTTLFGGNRSNSCPSFGFGCGVVFKIDLSESETVLHAFTGGADGANPYSRLIRDYAGNLFGTTFFGGYTGSQCPNGSTGCGVVFKLDAAGNETTLYSFTGGADGAGPFAGLLSYQNSFYGTTYSGGINNCNLPYKGCGVVFKLR